MARTRTPQRHRTEHVHEQVDAGGTMVMPGTEDYAPTPTAPRALPADFGRGTTGGKPGVPVAPADPQARTVNLTQITANPSNPRDDLAVTDTGYDAGARPENGIRELADSIAAQGLLEPPVIAPLAGEHGDPTDTTALADDDDAQRYVLVSGHRRFLALQHLVADGRHDGRVLCIVRDDLASPDRMSAAALVENLQRVDLTPLQEARGFARLRDSYGWPQMHIARAVGRSPGHVSKRIALLTAVPLLTELIETGAVPLNLAADLSRLEPHLQQRAARDIVRGTSPDVAARQAAEAASMETARARAVGALRDVGLNYSELSVGQRIPPASPRGPLPVDFPTFPWVRAAHDRAPHGSLPCEIRYVTATRHMGVTTDPGANSYPGYDPGFVTGRYCLDPDAHPAEHLTPATPDPRDVPTSSTGTASAVPNEEAHPTDYPADDVDDDEDTTSTPTSPALAAGRGPLFSDGAPHVPTTAAGSLPRGADAASRVGTSRSRTTQRDLTEATMLRAAFLHRLLEGKMPIHAAAHVAGALVSHVALNLDDPTVQTPARDTGADAAALAHAMRLLGPRQAPLDASPIAARKAALLATHGPDAGIERRTRFALALTLARGDQAVVVAMHALASYGGQHEEDLAPGVHLTAASTLTALSAWGHNLHPLEQTVVDTAPSPTQALAMVAAALAAPVPHEDGTGPVSVPETAADTHDEQNAPQAPRAGRKPVQRKGSTATSGGTPTRAAKGSVSGSVAARAGGKSARGERVSA